MPFSSRNFTSDASLNRGGGCVSWSSTEASASRRTFPSASCGRRTFPSSASPFPFPSPSASSVSETWP